jgi:Na+-transporting methylmalonyl-CoA/oxaloacetate decarboxylase beta subunit
VLLLCALLLPSAAPLIGMLTFGNLLRECGVVERLSRAAQNEIINIVTIMLGLAVGVEAVRGQVPGGRDPRHLVLGALAFCIGTAAGVLMGKIMHRPPAARSIR